MAGLRCATRAAATKLRGDRAKGLDHLTWPHLLYLAVMVSIIVAVTAVGANTLLLARCPSCGAKNLVDSARCRRCSAPLDDDATGR